MSFASYDNDNRGNRPRIGGQFTLKETGLHFEWCSRDWKERESFAPEFPSLIFVGPTGTDVRIAKIRKTVVEVVVDERADGTPVVEKWYTKKFRKYLF